MEIKILVWIVSSIAVGFLWRRLKLSLASGVIWSLVLSPILGLIIGFVWSSVKNKKNETKGSVNL